MGAGSSFVSTEYQREELTMESELMEKAFSVPVSVRLDDITASIIDGLAFRFGKSRNSIICEMLNHDALEALQALNPKDRLLVAEAGDKAYDLFLAKNPGVSASPGAVSNIARFYNGIDESRASRASADNGASS